MQVVDILVFVQDELAQGLFEQLAPICAQHVRDS
jgi:hypothetical protein